MHHLSAPLRLLHACTQQIDHGIMDEEQHAGQQGEEAPPSKRQRRPKSSGLSQQQLDAKFPGNVRARRAHESLQAALAAYRAAQQEGQLSAVQLFLEGPPPSDAAQREAAVGPPGCLPDFPSLYAMRETLRPKIWLPPRCPAAAPVAAAGPSELDLADPCSRQRRPRCTCASGPTAGGSNGNKETDAAPCNLFGSVVSNPFCSAVAVSLLDPTTPPALLPPGSAFLMSDGVGTLAPLVAKAAERRFGLVVADPPWCAHLAGGLRGFSNPWTLNL